MVIIIFTIKKNTEQNSSIITNQQRIAKSCYIKKLKNWRIKHFKYTLKLIRENKREIVNEIQKIFVI